MATLPSANSEIQNVFNQAENLDLILEDIMQDCVKLAPPRMPSLFTIPPSKLMRGKPYYSHDQLFWVMTKSGSHFPVVLKGTQIGDAIRISVLYDHEDYVGDPVKCDSPNSGHQAVFDVEPRTAGLQLAHYTPFNNLAVCSVTLFNSGCQSDEVTFRFKPMCLNSCSKVCSERLLKLEHLSNDGTILTTSTWNLRVCSIPKRDFELMMGSVDHNTGEKRKSLYGKISGKKKIKKEHEELAPANAEQEHQVTLSCPATRRESEVLDTVANWITGEASLDQPSSSGGGGMNEEIILYCDPEASTPLLEEKGSAQCVKTEPQPRGTSVAPQPFRCNPIYVQMNDIEDEKLVRDLILRLGGTVHELTLKK